MSEHEATRKLVERARESDPDAWEGLYRQAYTRLLAYALRRLPSRDDADDAISETFVRAYVRIGRFRWRGVSFTGWLFGILRNVILEQQRKRRKETRVLDEPAHPAPGPLEHLLAAEQLTAIRGAFSKLSLEDQEILELRVVGKLHAIEVAAVLGKREGAVRTAQSRAIARLRTLVEKEAGK